MCKLYSSHNNVKYQFLFLVKPNQHEGNLVHLLEELSRHRYIEFGIKLGLKPHMIENVTSPQRKEPRICFMSVLETWLKLGSKDRTWGILATALENVGEIEIAKKVKQENPNLEKEGKYIHIYY